MTDLHKIKAENRNSDKYGKYYQAPNSGDYYGAPNSGDYYQAPSSGRYSGDGISGVLEPPGTLQMIYSSLGEVI